jgi:hypothetical protein
MFIYMYIYFVLLCIHIYKHCIHVCCCRIHIFIYLKLCSADTVYRTYVSPGCVLTYVRYTVQTLYTVPMSVQAVYWHTYGIQCRHCIPYVCQSRPCTDIRTVYSADTIPYVCQSRPCTDIRTVCSADTVYRTYVSTGRVLTYVRYTVQTRTEFWKPHATRGSACPWQVGNAADFSVCRRSNFKSWL